MSIESAFAAPVNRRQMVQRLGGGFGAIGLASLLGQASAKELAPHAVPKAKRVIQLFMNGGPFGPDLLDPKPMAAKFQGQRPSELDSFRTERKTAGIMASPYQFKAHGESGLQVSELLPNFAKCIDDVCVLKSVYTDNPNHGPALLLMNNGTIVPTRPSMGSWFSYGLGVENESLPGYVVLCPGRPVRFSILWTSAFLPGEYQGTYINHSNLDPQKLIPYLRNKHLPVDEQQRQLELMRSLNRQHLEERGGDQQLDSRITAMETAFRMQFAATEAFDLNREPQHIREEYGSTHFANGCLLARRLAERGVRFTQVYYGDGQPWDTHNDHNNQVKNLCKDIDQPIAALLQDLKRRGMLEETLVIWGGEFGRTPTTENGDGRDHNHYGFTMWMAGGGIKGGMTYGETDDFGFQAVHNRVHIHDLHATILHQLGLNHERLTYRYAGRDFRLTDVAGRVIQEIQA
ncbi:DUF1501 domain-containing protein [Schlesneria sp. DSM 10557]|uniref:DUF1501 domain-containing protein n=1 Tax=Schlesneria sp. DSM 10557 TaxID=3044399 RepID=UPI00359F1DB2